MKSIKHHALHCCLMWVLTWDLASVVLLLAGRHLRAGGPGHLQRAGGLEPGHLRHRAGGYQAPITATKPGAVWQECRHRVEHQLWPAPSSLLVRWPLPQANPVLILVFSNLGILFTVRTLRCFTFLPLVPVLHATCRCLL
jgi:hypothetical protein